MPPPRLHDTLTGHYMQPIYSYTYRLKRSVEDLCDSLADRPTHRSGDQTHHHKPPPTMLLVQSPCDPSGYNCTDNIT